ncbi:MAG: ATP-binding protein [Phycisphaerales bacterium]
MDDQTSAGRLAESLTHLAADLEAELGWLFAVLRWRLGCYFEEPSRSPPLDEHAPPPPTLAGGSDYAEFLASHTLSAAERLVLAVALAPSLRPQLFDALWVRNEATGRGFAEFGGCVGTSHGAFLPTLETAIFLIAGDDLASRLSAARLLEPTSALARLGVIECGASNPGEPPLAAPLRPGPRAAELIYGPSTGAASPGPGFPGRRVETKLEWKDLVLPESTRDQLEEIRDWAMHGRTLLDDWNMRSRIRPGFTSLFWGPPGTGKTLSACLLGKLCSCPVYRIDLSMVVSKYIGETEKNLSRVFAEAERRGWILFFDEADALFGKRTSVDDAHDRYANQEVSYLLQRIEQFEGIVILASNLKSNIDDAFLRRFHSVIAFPLPKAPERLRLWRESLPAHAALEPKLNLERLAEQHEITGGTIINVARYACLRAIAKRHGVLALADLEEGLRRELQKEGRGF